MTVCVNVKQLSHASVPCSEAMTSVFFYSWENKQNYKKTQVVLKTTLKAPSKILNQKSDVETCSLFLGGGSAEFTIKWPRYF